MPRLKTYYPNNQITSGLYTPGKEWMLTDGTEFIGAYHSYDDGNIYTGSTRTPASKKLFPYYDTFFNSSKFRYTDITEVKVDKYVAPQYYFPRPTDDEYEQGWMNRYFVQKRNQSTIIEITKKQYSEISTSNSETINGNLYKPYTLRWKISGTRKEIETVNRAKVLSAESTISGMSRYLGNLLEFSKGREIWNSNI